MQQQFQLESPNPRTYGFESPNPFEIRDIDQDDFVSTDDWEDYNDDGFADEPFGPEYGTDDPWDDIDSGHDLPC